MELNYTSFLNIEEFFTIYSLIYKTEKTLTPSPFLPNLTYKTLKSQYLCTPTNLQTAVTYYKKVIKKRNSNKIPISIKLTFQILSYILKSPKNQKSIALDLIRNLNQLVDMNQKSKNVVSFSQILSNLGIERDLVDILSECRHAIVHKKFPSESCLEICNCFLILFLKEKFWVETLYKNAGGFRREKLEWFVLKLNSGFGTNYLVEDFNFYFGKKRIKVFKNYKREIEEEFVSENPLVLNLKGILDGVKDKNKKMKALIIMFNYILKNRFSKKQIDIVLSFISEHFNVSHFRNAFKIGKFKKLIYRIYVLKDLKNEFSDIWDVIISNYHKILKKNNFIELWDKQNKDKILKFDKDKYEFLSEKYIKDNIKNYFQNYYLK